MPFLEMALSEASRLKRRRQYKVNIQMTVISWSLEFITGLVGLSLRAIAQDPDTNGDFIAGVLILDSFMTFIIIPSSYILSTEVSKSLVIAEGWCKIFQSRIQSNQIYQNSEDGVNLVVFNVQPIPIPTISGNIKALSSQRRNDLVLEDLEIDLQELTAKSLFSNP